MARRQAILTTVHNTPFGDIVDTEDDLQPLVASMFRDAARMVTLVAAALKDAQFNVERLAARAAEGGTTITELADTLARDHGLPFGTAHKIAGLVVRARSDAPRRDRLGSSSPRRRPTCSATAIVYDDASDSRHVLSPRHFVETRQDPGRAGARAHQRGDCRLARGTAPPTRRGGRGRRDALVRAAGHPARRGPAPVTAMQQQYVRVMAVWVVVLAALYAFQEYFTP